MSERLTVQTLQKELDDFAKGALQCQLNDFTLRIERAIGAILARSGSSGLRTTDSGSIAGFAGGPTKPHVEDGSFVQASTVGLYKAGSNEGFYNSRSNSQELLGFAGGRMASISESRMLHEESGDTSQQMHSVPAEQLAPRDSSASAMGHKASFSSSWLLKRRSPHLDHHKRTNQASGAIRRSLGSSSASPHTLARSSTRDFAGVTQSESVDSYTPLVAGMSSKSLKGASVVSIDDFGCCELFEEPRSPRSGDRPKLRRSGLDDDEDLMSQASIYQSAEPAQVPSFWESFENSTEYHQFISVLIFMNAVAIGARTDFMARNWTQAVPYWSLPSDIFFVSLFVIDIVLRAFAKRSAFLCGAGWQWNVLDVIITLTQGVDVILQPRVHIIQDEIILLRFLRVIRVLRGETMTGLFRCMGGVRMLIASIEVALKSLGPVLVIFLLQTFIFSIFLTQVVTEHKMAAGTEEMLNQPLLEQFWGTLDRSVLSLYAVLSDGVHWMEIMNPLTHHCSPWLAIAFVIYIAFAVVTITNVVTGVFVDAALTAATDERKEILLQQMIQMFLDLDEDGSGTVDAQEFVGQMSTDWGIAFLRGIDLVPQDLSQLFDMLDADGSGEIDAEELVSGCLRLTGAAKAFDLTVFMHDYTQQMRCLREDVAACCKGIGVASSKTSADPSHFATLHPASFAHLSQATNRANLSGSSRATYRAP